MKGFLRYRRCGTVACAAQRTAIVALNPFRTTPSGEVRTAVRAAWAGIAFITAFSAPSARSESIFRCHDRNGHVEFSAQPCGAGAEVITIEREPPAGVDMGVRGDFSATAAANRTRERERGVAQQEQRIRALLRERDDRLATLRTRQAEVGDTRAGAAQRRLLAAEIRAAKNDYDARLRIERDRLAHLRRR